MKDNFWIFYVILCGLYIFEISISLDVYGWICALILAIGMLIIELKK